MSMSPEARRAYERRTGSNRRIGKRGEQKRAADELRRVPCAAGCGVLVWAHPGRSGRCKKCNLEKRRAERDDRRRLIGADYRSGLPVAEIARRLRTTPRSVNAEIFNMRRDGWDLPYRRAPR